MLIVLLCNFSESVTVCANKIIVYEKNKQRTTTKKFIIDYFTLKEISFVISQVSAPRIITLIQLEKDSREL